MSAVLRRIPHFVKAASPEGLRRLMFRTNVRDGVEYRFFDITYDGKSWVAWFYKIIPMTERIEEPIDGKSTR